MGSLLDQQHSGRPSLSDESVENIWNSFICSPKKSVRKCARELGLSKTTSWSFEKKKCLWFSGYKLQLLHAIHPGNNRKTYDFAMDILNEIEDEQFLHHVMLSDGATFHVSGYVHLHNVRIWANERLHDQPLETQCCWRAT
jgi:hypothetical protein